MRGDPVGQALGPGRFGMGIARSTEYDDKHLGGTHLTGVPIDNVDRRSTVVDERFLTGTMVLAQTALLLG